MFDSIIEVENLSKQYRLGEVSTGTVAHDLNRWWARMRGKEDPTLRVTHSNDRAHATDSDEEFVWALKDISFEVKRGEVLGIIGRNGAGKSTLLKILSRVTAPTTGEIRVDGRIASLLEVGTGFHPELTGRENIFLNGAILGMTKGEIRSKLDEIVEFSGCARYLDTPVKRYSSGMVVRLGFAVAAHLEPDILVVDEVLAVGDAEFQRKCIGKMQDVAGHGRTVLFVSHNMGMVNQLCSRAVIINEGILTFSGTTEDAIETYQSTGTQMLAKQRFKGVLADSIKMQELGINQKLTGNHTIRPSSDITIIVRGIAKIELEEMLFLFRVCHRGTLLFSLHDLPDFQTLEKGAFETSITIPAYTLRPGTYELGFGGGNRKNTAWFYSESVAQITILEEWDDRCRKNCPGLLNLPKDSLTSGQRKAGG